jgi:glycerol-3-phosphate dehydrogenase subunit C
MDTPERMMRKVVDDCTDCDICRYLMDTSCQFFPEIYRLWDREKETGEVITAKELRYLADLCNFCALCPCPDIRENIITAKTGFIDRDGLTPQIRLMEDVERLGKICGALPGLANFLMQNRHTGTIIKKAAGIHVKRKLPRIPKKRFSSWSERHKITKKTVDRKKRKVAYFAGCTARYLFPEVAVAAVEFLEANNISVSYPEQHCCGMPTMLEGDRQLTLKLSDSTVSHLAEIVADGVDIVCSCPTCGYMLKKALRKGAYYSETYQALVGGDERAIKVPDQMISKTATDGASNTDSICKGKFGTQFSSRETVKIKDPANGSMKTINLQVLDRSIFGSILKDDGYFSGIDPINRIRVAENTYDLGEFLLSLHPGGIETVNLNPVSGKMVYYPPCHLREQGIGTPYQKLLASIPGIHMEDIQSTVHCCGLGGIIGFKQDFHHSSIQMGSRLMAKIKRLNPDRLVTDCLSCRLQFNQMGDYPVQHPIEVLRNAL